MDFLNKCDGYFVEVVIKKVGKKQAFPLMSVMTKDKVRDFTNDMIGETMHVDKCSLEDLIQFQKVEVDIIRGYYYDEGRNTKISEVIDHLFSKRLEAKKNKNNIQLVYKLMMNALYGKSLLKPFGDKSIIKPFKQAGVYIKNNFKFIKSIEYLNNKPESEQQEYDRVLIKQYESIETHFNNAPCGVEVLSMSKRIMNEVMCLAETFKIDIFYQDTDSMHVVNKDIVGLSKLYRGRYGRELIGKNMGQFHSDFASDKLEGDIWSVESIFLGKKCYIDKITDGTNVDYHTRMKGVNKNAIDYVVVDSDYMGLYNKLLTVIK
jgi:hypothetical protein